MPDLFPLLQLTKNLKSAPVLYTTIFSAPETKAQVHYALFVVRPSSLTFHIVDFTSETAERNSTKHDRKQDIIVVYQACFLVWSEKQDGRPLRSVKKVAHCTQVHYIWPFGPHILSWIYFSCFTLYMGKLLIVCKPSARYIWLTMKYNMFKGMVHFGRYIDTYISLHILLMVLFSINLNRTQKGATRRPWSVRTLFAFSTFFFRILVDSSTLLGRYAPKTLLNA